MRKRPEFHALAAALALALLAGGCARKPDGIGIKDAWVRLSPLKGEPAAAYFEIAGGAEGTKLLGLSSPMVRRVELHESMTGGGMARMKPLKDVDFDYRGRIRFEPGGKHAMLFGLDRGVKEGSTLALTFAFNAAPPITIDAEVRGPSGEPHNDH
jgi:periplasmic copper chaperone A